MVIYVKREERVDFNDFVKSITSKFKNLKIESKSINQTFGAFQLKVYFEKDVTIYVDNDDVMDFMELTPYFKDGRIKWIRVYYRSGKLFGLIKREEPYLYVTFDEIIEGEDEI